MIVRFTAIGGIVDHPSFHNYKFITEFHKKKIGAL
jgi:hypothetical protein